MEILASNVHESSISRPYSEPSPDTIKGAKKLSFFLLLILFFLLLIGVLILAMALGAKKIPFSDVFLSIFAFDEMVTNHQVIQSIRLPRVLAAMATGAGFAVSGAIIQGISRNPLADSGILGLNAGAGVMLVIAMIFLPTLTFTGSLWLCIIGAALGAGLVFSVGLLSKRGLTPIRLVLAGVAISSMLTALSEGISIFFSVSQQVAFWYGGGLSGISMAHLQQMLPWMILALLLAIAISKSITLLYVGEETAQGLGVNIKLIKSLSLLSAFMLAGISCALAGSVSFIGLLAPHLVRYLVGVDYRFIIPLSAILGAIIVVLTDLVARIVNAPYEIPVGAVIAVIGIPFFLFLARKERRGL
ncbi:FecCD family ABC transporter permease [Paenibacillus endoradicis]|uniref:FecCD family ABC transporter permease n=1 Tax=Paenibacillus endoradicis TaxID=2972487 RepID=UPI002158FE14|nr:iron ABC transporter permease [Paenibacillus endoradicis]MCR8657509.1 iron ABC transporter permease [Paenibacillus endoradicis]